MDFLRFSITNPVKIAVGVIIILMFGLIALLAIPIQLTPNVDQPKITIETNWTGRSPEEIEREIIEEQEDKLKSIQGLRKMKATASLGMSQIELEFNIGTDMTRALQEVSDKLREVPEYPDEVDEPVINVADSASGDANAIAWMLIRCDDPGVDIQALYDDVDKRVKPYLERVPGLAEINIYGGREREVHIRIDPRRMAERGITFNQLSTALRMENVNVSAGEIPEGRLDVRVRTVGQYDNLDDVRETIVAYADGGPVRVRDLADVELTLQKRRTFVRANGQPALALSAIRESNSNVIAVMAGLRERIEEVNERRSDGHADDGVLEQILPGKNLRLEQVYDETVYIYDALALVKDNIWQGGALAVLVLLIFLRAIRPTIIIAISIPISLIGTFVVMAAAGRNINVISLAGLAFASGNVVNAAIVVLENIDRHLGMGKSPLRAAYDGTREVWPSVFNTTLTTLVVFLPVIFMQEEAGQLFRDISLAICASVGLSMLVAVTVIPSAAARFLKPHTEARHPVLRAARSLFGLAEPVGKVADGIAGTVDRLNRQPLIGGPVRVIVSLAGLGLLCIGIAVVWWRAQQGELVTFKTLLTPVWIEIFGAALVLCGLALAGYGAGVKAIRRGASRMTALDVSTLVVTGVLLAACGVWLIAVFSGDGTLKNLKDMTLACAVLLIGLLVAAVGMAMLPARIAVVSLFTFGSLLGAWLLMPPTTYLPSGNRNLVFGMMLTPPSYSVEQNQFIGERIEMNLRPYWEAQTMEDTAKLPPAMEFDMQTMQLTPVQSPPIDDYFFVSWGGTVFMGAASREPEVVKPLGALLGNSMQGIPGSFGFASQISIFGMGIAGSNSIEVEISGSDLDEVRAAAGALYGRLTEKYGFMSVQPMPMNFNLAGPELRIKIDRVRAADLGVDVTSLGLGVQALVDGAVVGDYRYEGDAIDMLMVRDTGYPLTPDALGAVPVAYRDAGGNTGTVPLASIAQITHEAAPQEIRRIEEMRAVTLTVMLPEGVPLETATNDIRDMGNQMKDTGVIPRSVIVEPAGTADKLTQVRRAMFGEWRGWTLESLYSLVMSRMVIALVITYLLMAALFESFLYPFVIMFTVPLATIGGFMGLALVHATDHSQLFDVLTMLGFVILIGIVVDNATLLVYQALNYMKGFGESEQDIVARLSPREAIRESVRTRLRPIMMASLTNFFGTLPLVLMPGAGSELYKGLGAVVLGGMLVATVFTLLVVPLVFSMTLDLKIWVYRRRGWPVPELNEGDRIETPAAPVPA